MRNTNDAISMVNTYDGGAAEIEQILIRMRELAVQARTGTYTGADLTNADYEYSALKSEIERIAGVTAFNRIALGQGGESGATSAAQGVTSAATQTFSFYVGSDVARTGNTITFTGKALDLNKDTSATGLKTILAPGGANGAGSAIESLDDALQRLSSRRAEAGALVNRLEHTVSNLMNVSQRLQEAVSGVEDADYAAESAALARGMVLAQAGTAMLAQANQAPQFVLTLLRS